MYHDTLTLIAILVILMYCIGIVIFLNMRGRDLTTSEAWLSLIWPLVGIKSLCLSIARLVNCNILVFVFVLFGYRYDHSKLYNAIEEYTR